MREKCESFTSTCTCTLQAKPYTFYDLLMPAGLGNTEGCLNMDVRMYA